MPNAERRAKSVQVARRRDAMIQDLVQGVPRKEVIERYGYSDRAALSKDISRTLAQTRASLDLTVDEYRRMQLETLDALAVAAWRVLHAHHVKVANGEVIKVTDTATGEQVTLEDTMPTLAAIDRVLRIEAQRMDLLGTRAPAQVEVGGTMRVVVTAVDLRELQ